MYKYLFLILSIILACPAYAAERLDDSLSPVKRLQPTLDWLYKDDSAELSMDELNTITGSIENMEIRLDTSAHIGTVVKIYLRLPLRISGFRSPTGLKISWTTKGEFRSGSATPGTRSLIFSGRIQRNVMSDIFNLTILIDAREFTDGFNFEPIFEIETP